MFGLLTARGKIVVKQVYCKLAVEIQHQGRKVAGVIFLLQCQIRWKICYCAIPFSACSISTIFCTCHDSTAVMACAKFSSNHFIKIRLTASEPGSVSLTILCLFFNSLQDFQQTVAYLPHYYHGFILAYRWVNSGLKSFIMSVYVQICTCTCIRVSIYKWVLFCFVFVVRLASQLERVV